MFPHGPDRAGQFFKLESWIELKKVSSNKLNILPELEFTLPIDESGEWHGDDERPSAVALLVERVEEGDGLDGFAETHLVGQDNVGAALPAMASPVQAFNLKLF